MKITWLGQAGLLFETNDTKIIIDPYLSDSIEKVNPKSKRNVPVDETFLKIKPDILILTHDHLDHTDPETISHYINENTSVTVLASGGAWAIARKMGGSNNYVKFDTNTVWTHGDFVFTAVKACHSDEKAIGVIIEHQNKTYYVTGDTLYNKEIFDTLPKKIDYVFLPINGKGNNMNMLDAKKFCEKLKCKAIPLHCGLFDDIDMNEFPFKNKVVPEFYKEIKL